MRCRGGWPFDAGTLTVTPATPYLNAARSGADVIEMTFTVVVEVDAANVNGAGRDNTGSFRFATRQTSQGLHRPEPHRSVDRPRHVVEPVPTITKNEDDADTTSSCPASPSPTRSSAGNTGTSPGHDTVITDCVPIDLDVQPPVAAPVSPGWRGRQHLGRTPVGR